MTQTDVRQPTVRTAVHVPVIVTVYVLVFLVALPVLLWAMGGHIDRLLALPSFESGALRSTGGLIAAGGVGWMAWSMSVLKHRGDGWPISALPPSRLVLAGPYAVMRHPIYVGAVVAFGGFALADGSRGRLLGATPLLAALAVNYVLGGEGPQLRQRFGHAYSDYSATLPRFPLVTLAERAWGSVRGPVERLANRVVLFRVGPAIFVTYGLLVAAGTALAQLTAAAVLARDGMSIAAISGYLLTACLTMALGARIAWFASAPARESGLGIRGNLRRVGFVSWGAYVGFAVATVALARVENVSVLWLTDRTVLAALACSVVGRLGCLTYGCCYGRPSAAGIRWTHPEAKVVRELASPPVARIPTPLISSLATAATIVVAGALTYRPVPAGTVTAVAVLLYGLGRFATDALRDRTNQLHGAHLSSGQVNSLGLIVVASSALFVLDGPPTWAAPITAVSWSAVLPLLPAVTVATLVAFLLAGFHWRKVGTW